MGGEGGAAQAHDAGVLDDLHQLLGAQVLRVLHGFDRGVQGVLVVVVDDHAEHLPAPKWGRGSTAVTVPETLAWMGALT